MAQLIRFPAFGLSRGSRERMRSGQPLL
jgi:uncharacterized protein YjbJ (UPF0337 family)